MSLSETQIKDVLKYYGHSFARLDFVQSGYRNTSHIVETSNSLLFNFILYKNESEIVERIKRVNALSSFLVGRGLPVRAPVDERIMSLKSFTATRYGSLYSFLPGESIPWEAYTKKHIKLLGMALGKFHRASESYSEPLPKVTDEYLTIVWRMKKYFADHNVSSAMKQKLSLSLQPNFFEHHEVILSRCEHLPDQRVLHMDLVRGNVLFREAENDDALIVGNVALCGILDLEKASFGHPFFDVARTLAFLMVDCSNKDPEKIRKYFIDSGYRKRGGCGLPRVKVGGEDLLDQLTSLFLVYDLYKFLRQNPYESLSENYHYMRTIAQLIARGVLVKHSNRCLS